MQHSTKRPVEDRFWAKVQQSGDCWQWTAAERRGYGQFGVNSGNVVQAHRWAYEHMVAEIPAGLTLDHLCENTFCVNPAHLDPVPMRVNVLRSSSGLTARNARKTHCVKGHPFSSENTKTRSRGGRRCGECERSRWSSSPVSLSKGEVSTDS